MPFLLIVCVVVIIFLFSKYILNKKKDTWKAPVKTFPESWRTVLLKEVNFYNSLSIEDKEKFEFKVHEFLLNCRITGVKTEVDTTDKVLVAASAIIPIFGFDHWQYINIKEVLIYPTSFNKDFEIEGKNRNILGMVGYGYMDGLMILSKQALHIGFANETDKHNTAIHEFIHLIDKSDGKIDGIPEVLLEKEFTLPWVDLIQKKMEEIHQGKSDIRNYGGTNKAEFFSVASEYFFERPKLLKRKHPELYLMLEEMFNQKMTSKQLNIHHREIGRNEPCPCNSGKKFKKCCGKNHYAA